MKDNLIKKCAGSEKRIFPDPDPVGTKPMDPGTLLYIPKKQT
jgi:hypothetical protein